MTSFTLQNVLVPTQAGYTTLDVQVIEGRIAAVGAGLPIVGPAIDGTGKLLLPGFVNAHTHSPEMWYRGLIPPLPLELWLGVLYNCPALTPEQTYLSALWTAAETLLSGGTTVVDHLILSPGQELETIAAAVQAYEEIGIRAYVAPLMQDHPLAAGIPQGQASQPLAPTAATEEMLLLLETAIQRYHRPQQHIHIAIGPTGLQLCSDTFLKECLALSQQHQLCRHLHLLETKAQNMLAYERYGMSAVRHLEQLGFLGPDTSLAHCVWLDNADLALLSSTQATVVHNPLSNLRLGSGIAPVLQYRKAGVNVTFGCDGAASNDGQDLLEAIRLGAMLHNTTDFEYHHWLTHRQILEMATQGGAAGLGQAQQFGSLTVGQQADLVLYDLNARSMMPHTDPLGLLLVGRPVNVVHSAWVKGSPVVQQGQLTSVDLDALLQKIRAHRPEVALAPPAILDGLESQYRQVMNL